MLTAHRASVRALLVASALAASAALAGCSASISVNAGGGDSTTAAGGDAPATTDVCALVPQDALTTFLGADPGAGVADAGKVDGGQCTWKVSDTASVLLQYTHQPDAYLPESVYPKPDGASDIAGADRGFDAASSNTILIVKGQQGLLLTYIAFGTMTPDQDAYDALANEMIAQLG